MGNLTSASFGVRLGPPSTGARSAAGALALAYDLTIETWIK